MHVGDILSTVGDVQYHGEYDDRCRGFNTLSTVGDIMSTVGVILSIVGCYLEYCGTVGDTQYHGGYHDACGGYHEYFGGV